jgi:hypothetical protein
MIAVMLVQVFRLLSAAFAGCRFLQSAFPFSITGSSMSVTRHFISPRPAPAGRIVVQVFPPP